MASAPLTRDELHLCCDIILDYVKESIKRRRDLLNAGKISLADSWIISDEETALLIAANRAANMVVTEVLIDMEKPGEVLTKTATELQAVIQKLKELNQFLGMFARLVKLFNRIVAAAATGPGAIAQIGPLIDELQDFISTL